MACADSPNATMMQALRPIGNLGRQKIGESEAFVLAFAQIPGHDSLNSIVDLGSHQSSTPSRGIAWIEQSTHKILQMRRRFYELTREHFPKQSGGHRMTLARQTLHSHLFSPHFRNSLG